MRKPQKYFSQQKPKEISQKNTFSVLDSEDNEELKSEEHKKPKEKAPQSSSLVKPGLRKERDRRRQYEIEIKEQNTKPMENHSPSFSLKSSPKETVPQSFSLVEPGLEVRPEIIVANPIPFEKFSKKTPLLLANACKFLLQEIEKDFYPKELLESYCMEFRPHGEDWKLSIRFDPLIWFERFLRKDSKKENFNWNKCLEIAQKWIEEQRELISERKHSDPPTEDLIEVSQYCPYPGSCTFGSKCRRGTHATISCGEKLQRTTGTSMPCNWYVRDEFQIKIKPFDPRFVVYVRNEPKREVVVAPYGKSKEIEQAKTMKWNLHYNNKDMVILPDFWKFVCDTCKFLQNEASELDNTNQNQFPIEKITLNFGYWETAMNENKLAKDCHAHLHIHLMRSLCNALVKSDDFKMLRGRIEDVENYQMKDCDLLETRILGYQMTQLRNEVRTGMKSMDGRLNSMEDKIESLSGQISDLTAFLKSNKNS